MLMYLRLTIIAASLALAAPVLAGDTLNLNVKPPPPGTKFTESGDLKISLKIDLKAGPKAIQQEFGSQTTKKREVEVLATEKDAIVKARVKYVAHDEVTTQGQAPPKTKSHPFVGKTYILERKGETLLVTNEQGVAAPPDEALAIRGEDKDFGKPNQMLSQFPKTFEAGKPVEIGDAMARAMMGEADEKMNIESATITYRKTKKVAGRTAALFDLRFVIAVDQAPMKMKMDLRGKAVVVVDGGWPMEFTLEGPITLMAAQPGVEINGTGKAGFGSRWTYR